MNKEYKFKGFTKTSIRVNETAEGQTLENAIERAKNNKEPLSGTDPMIYTARKDGVIPAYNPKTDRFSLAAEASDKLEKGRIARAKAKMEVVKGGEGEIGDQSTQATN